MSISTPTPTASEAASGFVNSRPFEWLARAGFVARGLVYGIIGLLALKLAIGSGGKATDQQGAMRTLAQQPFGRTMLIALAVGLAGYAMWRFTRAALGRGPEGSDRGLRPHRRARERARLRRVLRARDQDRARFATAGKTGSPKATTAGVLSWPAGPLLVGLAGLVFVGIAGYQAYRGVTEHFSRTRRPRRCDPR